jgi:hypothetical protein
VYQGHPYQVGGGMFRVELFRTIRVLDRREVIASVLAVDKAGTAGGDGAYTAIVLLHTLRNGTYVIERVVRGHWAALEREQVIKQGIETDRANMGRHYRVNYQIVLRSSRAVAAKKATKRRREI